jgi:hypothetical protein
MFQTFASITISNQTDEFAARITALENANRVGATHVFMLSSLARLSNPDTLTVLLAEVRSIISVHLHADVIIEPCRHCPAFTQNEFRVVEFLGRF